MRLISSGHLIAVTRANSYMCESGYVKDMTSGAGYYHFLDKLEKNFDEKKQEIVDTLEELVKKLFTKQNVILSFTAEKAGYECMEGYFKEFTDRLYESTEEEKPNAVVLRVYYTAENATKALKRLPKCSMWQGSETLRKQDMNIMVLWIR